MLTTRRYEYLHIDNVRIHPDIGNHRPLDERKVEHYRDDILQHGLLEPLVVWEKNRDEYYLVGGFHRLAAIRRIREEKADYFERIDVRVVSADLDEIKALNLKLNADRVDTKITDFFDTIIHLNNVNWPKERIAEFFDRSVSWIEEIVRYVPAMPADVRQRMEDGRLSWARAQRICRAIRDAEAGTERQVLKQELAKLDAPSPAPSKRPLTLRHAKKRLAAQVERSPNTIFAVSGEQLLSLLIVLEGKDLEEEHLKTVQSSFPGLFENKDSARKAV